MTSLLKMFNLSHICASLLVCTILLMSNIGFSQCPMGDVHLRTQSELNDFKETYPDCTEINGNLLIGYDDGTTLTSIDDLSPLENIKKINNLEISRNEDLMSLDGLNNLQQVNGLLKVNLNRNLRNITALKSLSQVSSINISHNVHLRNFDGLQNTPTKLDNLILWNNYRAEHLSHLSHITEIKSNLTIALFNSYLNSLFGLHNIKRVGGRFKLKRNNQLESLNWLHPGLIMGELSITEHPKLSDCLPTAVCRHITSGKPLTYDYSNAECQLNNAQECDGLIVRGNTFYDENKNGIFDDDEKLVTNVKLKVNDENILSGPTSSYSYMFESDNPPTISMVDTRFKVTTNNETTEIEVIPGDPEIINNDIGLVFVSDVENVKLYTIDFGMICGTKSRFKAIIKNEGSPAYIKQLIINYNSEVEFNNILEDYSYSHNEFDRSITIDIEANLKVFEEVTLNLDFDVGPIESPNEIIEIESVLNGDEDNMIASNDFSTVVLCSYDPNDIQVSPDRGGENFVSLDTPLRYRIRFENMGNYYARDILIKNEISEKLDLGSISIIESSHEMNVLLEDRTVNFIFNNIDLPATSQDSLLSMGYVIYSINSDTEECMPSDRIENQAEIYFDINPAIVTNIAHATIENNVSTSNEVLEADNLILNTIVSDYLFLKKQYDTEINYVIRNINSQTVKAGTTISGIDVSNFDSGIYFISVQNKHQLLSQKWIKL